MLMFQIHDNIVHIHHKYKEDQHRQQHCLYEVEITL